MPDLKTSLQWESPCLSVGAIIFAEVPSRRSGLTGLPLHSLGFSLESCFQDFSRLFGHKPPPACLGQVPHLCICAPTGWSIPIVTDFGRPRRRNFTGKDAWRPALFTLTNCWHINPNVCWNLYSRGCASNRGGAGTGIRRRWFWTIMMTIFVFHCCGAEVNTYIRVEQKTASP